VRRSRSPRSGFVQHFLKTERNFRRFKLSRRVTAGRPFPYLLTEEIARKDANKVDIKFSRHAKRRAKLYKIPEIEIKKIIESANLSQGEHELVQQVPGFRYPIKIIVVAEPDRSTVVTTYPLKKGKTNESTL
jgi:hypothetical protein